MGKSQVFDNTPIQAKHRDSNIELFRIITMILIIAHHYVVNSGLLEAGGPVMEDPMSWRSIFLLIFGAWGKIGINCFVLITGYFMCKSRITASKFFKLLFEVMFYRIVIDIVFWITGDNPIGFKGLARELIPIKNIGVDFTSAYLVFFLFIPFINILIHKINETQHIKLLLLSSFLYVVLVSIPSFSYKLQFSVTMNYVSWFIVLYFFASYIRLYPKKLFERTRFWGIASLICVVLCCVSIIVGVKLSIKYDRSLVYFFVADSNKFLALVSGISFFMFFKNLKIKYSKFINTVAASTFGVLLIHAHSDTMRKWLWRDLLDNVGHYNSRLMPLHAFGTVICIFIVCTCIDRVRIVLIEKPFFKLFDKKLKVLEEKYNMFEKKLSAKLDHK